MNVQLKWLSLKTLVKPLVESKVLPGGFGPSGFQVTLLSAGGNSVGNLSGSWVVSSALLPSLAWQGYKGLKRDGGIGHCHSTDPSPAASSSALDTDGDRFLFPKLSIPHRLSNESQAPTFHYSAARWRNGGWSMGVSI